ncbi:transposase [uncultured Polaribacter sp.]|uniref:transposase n=1 Tax=uncultured Polaribacter sp. TaxID=174711 RepID=UPI00345C7C8E
MDSTHLKSMSIKKRKNSIKFLKILLKKSYETKGRHLGFKLHLVCNYKGKIIDFMYTPANLDDRYTLK